MADFSIAKQCDILLKAEEVWADSQNQTEMYSANAETIKALATEQKDRTKILTSIEDPTLEEDEVKVVWLDLCETAEPDDCDDVCDFDGPEPELDSKVYKMDKCKQLSFSLDENNLLRNKYTLEEAAAKKLLNIKKAMDEYLNRQSLLFLTANAGYNRNQQGGTWDPNTMIIDAENYNNNLMVKMAKDSVMNQIKDAFVIDSGELYDAKMLAQLGKDDCCGKGEMAKSGLFNTYFDLFGFPTAPVTDSTFLVSPHAYAIANRVYNPTSPTEFEASKGLKQIRYTIASDNIPGVQYDVYYQKECSGRRFKHVWLVQVNWEFLLNPAGCEIGVGNQVTGILSYTKEGIVT